MPQFVFSGGSVREAVIVASSRTPLAKSHRGSFKDTRPDDLAATIFYLLGIDPHTEVRGVGNRPLLIASGNPVNGVVA